MEFAHLGSEELRAAATRGCSSSASSPAPIRSMRLRKASMPAVCGKRATVPSSWGMAIISHSAASARFRSLRHRATLDPPLLHHSPRLPELLAHLLDQLRVGFHPQPLRAGPHVLYPADDRSQDHRGELLRAHARHLLAKGRVAGPDTEGLFHAAALELVQHLRQELVVLLRHRLHFVRLALHGGVLLILVGLHPFAFRTVLWPRRRCSAL